MAWLPEAPAPVTSQIAAGSAALLSQHVLHRHGQGMLCFEIGHTPSVLISLSPVGLCAAMCIHYPAPSRLEATLLYLNDGTTPREAFATEDHQFRPAVWLDL